MTVSEERGTTMVQEPGMFLPTGLNREEEELGTWWS